MISCPNKRLKAWKDLEAIYGENKAYGLWNKYNGYPPDYLYEVKKSNVIPLTEQTRFLYEKYNLLNEKGKVKIVPYKEALKWAATLNKSSYYTFKVGKTEAGYRIFIYPKDSDQTSLQFNKSQGETQITQEVMQELLDKLKNKLGVNYILSNTTGDPYYTNNTVVIPKGNLTLETPLHEFSHPIFDALEKYNPKLFNKLIRDILNTEEGKQIEETVKKLYPEDNNTSKQLKEIGVRALTEVAKKNINPKTGKSFLAVIKRLFYALKQMFREIFGKNINITELNEDTTLQELADILTVGKGKLDLLPSNQVKYRLTAVNQLLTDKAKQVFDKGIKNGWTLDKVLNEIGGFANYKQLFNQEDLGKKVSELQGIKKLEDLNITYPDEVRHYKNNEKVLLKEIPKWFDLKNNSIALITIAKVLNIDYSKFEEVYSKHRNHYKAFKNYLKSENISDETEFKVDNKGEYFIDKNAEKQYVKEKYGDEAFISEAAQQQVEDFVENREKNFQSMNTYKDWKEELIKLQNLIKVNLIEEAVKDFTEQLALDIAGKYSYTVEINIAKESLADRGYTMVDRTGNGDFEPEPFEPDVDYIEEYDEEGNIVGIKPVLSEKGKKQFEIKNTQYYSNLTVPGGTNYTENEISIPGTLVEERPKGVTKKQGVDFVFEQNPELANAVYEAVGIRNPNITVLPNGNLKIVAFRTEKVGPTSKGEYQRGKGLYLSLDRPYPGEDVYTVEIEISPKNLLDRKLGFGEISEDYFIDEKNKRVHKQLDTLHEFKQSLGIKAEIGSIDGALMNELVLFDKELIDKALASKQVYNPQQKQQALEVYSQYLDQIFPDSKVKDIVYHGSPNIFEEFSDTLKGKNTGINRPIGVYFTPNRKIADFLYQGSSKEKFDDQGFRYREKINTGKVYSVLLNLNYIKTGDNFIHEKDSIDEYDTEGLLEYDAYVAKNKEQIHILGSKQDIEGFKSFIKSNTKNVRKGAITPSIKGHAQFSTDNGIGWFRSDDKTIDNVSSIPESDKRFVTRVDDSLRTPTKTRRILEIQSDWAQKIRKSNEPDFHVKYDMDKIINDLQKSGELKIKCD